MRCGVHAWPYHMLWGDERQAVRDYLKKKYLTKVIYPLTHEKVKEGTTRILEVCTASMITLLYIHT